LKEEWEEVPKRKKNERRAGLEWQAFGHCRGKEKVGKQANTLVTGCIKPTKGEDAQKPKPPDRRRMRVLIDRVRGREKNKVGKGSRQGGTKPERKGKKATLGKRGCSASSVVTRTGRGTGKTVTPKGRQQQRGKQESEIRNVGERPGTGNCRDQEELYCTQERKKTEHVGRGVNTAGKGGGTYSKKGKK